MTTFARCRLPEIMDSPDLDAERHRRALDALGRINRICRSPPQLWKDISRRYRDRTPAPLRILDLACGGGDVALGLEAAALRHGVDVRVRGCDVSPLAVARARETAARRGSRAEFFCLDVISEPLPRHADIVCCTLFLHHLDEPQAIGLLRRMAEATRHLIVVQDLERSRLGYVLAVLGVHLLTRSDVARVDGPLSVRAAFTAAEARSLAREAGLDARVRRFWPRRYSLSWARS